MTLYLHVAKKSGHQQKKVFFVLFFNFLELFFCANFEVQKQY